MTNSLEPDPFAHHVRCSVLTLPVGATSYARNIAGEYPGRLFAAKRHAIVLRHALVRSVPTAIFRYRSTVRPEQSL
jgi:hypothetical protein